MMNKKPELLTPGKGGAVIGYLNLIDLPVKRMTFSEGLVDEGGVFLC